MGSVIGNRQARRPGLYKAHGKIVCRVSSRPLKKQEKGRSLSHGYRAHGGEGREHGDARPSETGGQLFPGDDDRQAVLSRKEQAGDGLPQREFPGGLGEGRGEARQGEARNGEHQ